MNCRASNMIFKNPICSPVCSLFLFLFLLFSIKFFGMAQNATIPVNVGVVVDYDSLFGKIGLSCINMALSDFYATHGHYSTRLLLHTRDSMGDAVVQAASALDLIKNFEVQAIIIGPESSMQTDFVIDLGDKVQVPIISFSTTSPSLTSFRSSYFFRVTQNDASQVQAISAIIKAFGWSEAVPIFAENEFGEGIIPYVNNALQEAGIRIRYWSVVPPMATDEEIHAKLQHLMTMQTGVFIVHMLPSLGSRLFSKAKEIGMMGKGYAWILTDGMTNFFGSVNSSVLENMQGALGLRTYVPNTQELENFGVRWQRKFRKDNPTILKVELDVFGLWAYDAAWALALAVENVRTTDFNFQKMNISGNSSTDILQGIGVSQSGPELVQALSSTKFRGLSGPFSLVNGHLHSCKFQIVNVHGNGVKGIGYWTPHNGLVRNLNSTNTSTYSNAGTNSGLGTIIWPGDTTTNPKGWRIHNHGYKLKVLVPSMASKKFVNVTYDPITGTHKVTGYCIEVFETLIKEVPDYGVINLEYHLSTSASYDDLIDQVFLGNYDAAVGDITIRPNRSLYVDFTLPYTESGISMVVPIKRREDAWVFLKPLTWDLWVVSGCFFIFIGFVVWVLEHRVNEDFRGPPRHQIGTSFWFSFSTMVFAQRERVVSNLARFVVIVWCFVVLVLTQSYTASLASLLTVQQLQPTIADVNLLLKNRDNVGYSGGNPFVNGTLKHLGFKDDNIRVYYSNRELDELFEEGHVSAAFDETPYMKLFLSTYCSKYAIVEPTFNAGGFGFVFRKGSPLTLAVSKAITNLGQGVLSNIEKTWFQKNASKYCIEHSNATGSSKSSNSRLFRGLFMIALFSSILALLIFASMLLYEHRHILMHSDPQASFWTRICAILKTYDQKDTSSYTFGRSRLQDAVVHGIGAIEPSPNNNINCSPRPSTHSNHTDQLHSTVFEMQETSSTTTHGDLNPNGQATSQESG